MLVKHFAMERMQDFSHKFQPLSILFNVKKESGSTSSPMVYPTQICVEKASKIVVCPFPRDIRTEKEISTKGMLCELILKKTSRHKSVCFL